MYVAALGRFVLAVDCFAPNTDRIHQSIQINNIANRIVLVQNALFSRSGEFLHLSANKTNIGGQAIQVSNNETILTHSINNSFTNNPYIVKTITFDELLPIFIQRGIRGALMKIDIEGSESFVVESGGRMFDTLELPFVQMEWFIVRQYADRAKVILDFFFKRNYNPTTCNCIVLNSTQYASWPSD
ncbi:unnamed protein product, partial [Adineta steineri]